MYIRENYGQTFPYYGDKSVPYKITNSFVMSYSNNKINLKIKVFPNYGQTFPSRKKLRTNVPYYGEAFPSFFMGEFWCIVPLNHTINVF